MKVCGVQGHKRKIKEHFPLFFCRELHQMGLRIVVALVESVCDITGFMKQNHSPMLPIKRNKYVYNWKGLIAAQKIAF